MANLRDARVRQDELQLHRVAENKIVIASLIEL